MSRENVKVVRRFVDAFERRDDATVLALADPEIEFRSDLLEQQTFRGREPAGIGTVNSREVEDAKIRRIDEYMDRDEALEAAGLRE